MSIMANYLVFMTFFPASLALVLEVSNTHIAQGAFLAPSSSPPPQLPSLDVPVTIVTIAVVEHWKHVHNQLTLYQCR